MWIIPTWKLIKDAWPVFVLVAAAILFMGGAAIIASLRGCGSSDAGPDYLDDVKAQILSEVERERKENEAKLKILEAELYDLRIQVDTLDEEVRASAEEREEIHDAIDHATSIDDIDRILRGGIPGVSGRHD